jgi:hypothetical protein
MATNETLYEQNQNIYTKDKVVTTDTKPLSVYMTNRFLSLSVRSFLSATDCNASVGMPEWAKLPFLYYTIKKCVPPKIDYQKLEKMELSPKRRNALRRICVKFCVSPYHGMQILLLLESQGFVIEAN